IRSAEENSIDVKKLIKEIKHIGTSVMDVYTGELSVKNICGEVNVFLEKELLESKKAFAKWAGRNYNDFKIITLSDTSQWMLKYHNNEKRYVHLFPARLSPHSFRVKANTLKSAILYYIIIGKDYISRYDLNRARALLGLSPVKGPDEAEAITEMIEMLRG
ncbi:MAG: hypothetical protein NTZ85_01260, partial [Bacteroidia bacterium]|nr:hypothetical protein [Bacteroidia bacterium]